MAMETLLVSILVVLIIGLFIILWLLIKQPFSGHKKDDQALLMLQNQLTEVRKTLDSKLGESTQVLQRQFSDSANIIRNVTEKLTKLDETNRQVVNFADQLKNLQDILKNPKQRGILGEYYLETVLKNVLPPNNFQMQYAFKDGTIVDAVIFIGKKIIPIDSKFSLENYNRLLETHDENERIRFEAAFRQDLKNRIDETSKYIKPGEGTMDFAFMFIPSEGIFYDILINKIGTVNAKDLVEYAFNDKKVIIVSPTSFFAYLQTVMQGLRALKIEESAKEIRKNVEQLERHISSYETYLKKLGNNLGTSVNMYNQAYKEFGKIDKDVLKITGKSKKVEPMILDKPKDFEENEEDNAGLFS